MFNNLIGNDNNKITLSSLVNKENISHSYIFSGIEGIGKFLFAKEFAKAILCGNDVKLCNTCQSCENFENGNHPDICIIDNGNESIKTELIKELTNNVFKRVFCASLVIFSLLLII